MEGPRGSVVVVGQVRRGEGRRGDERWNKIGTREGEGEGEAERESQARLLS